MNRCDAGKCGVKAEPKVEPVQALKTSYPTKCPECGGCAVSKRCKCMLENGKPCSDYRCAACKYRWHFCRDTGENVEGEIVEDHVFCKRCDDELGVYLLEDARKKYEELLAKYGSVEADATSPVNKNVLMKLDTRVSEMHMTLVELVAKLDRLSVDEEPEELGELGESEELGELGESEDELDDEMD